MTPAPKPSHIIARKLRQSAKGKACTLRLLGCDGGDETTVLAHLRGIWALGIGQKPDDTFAVYACHNCHQREETDDWCTDHDRLRALYESQHIMIAEGLISIGGRT